MTSIWTGSRVRLRPVEPDDWAAFKEFDQDTDAERLGGGVYLPRSAVAYQDWARKRAERAKNDPELPIFLAVVALDIDVVVGSISTHNESEQHGRFAYGIGLGAAYHRKGYASDAMRILFGFMFRERRFHKVEAGAWDFNEASVALQRRFGFVEEGRRRQAWYLDGEYHDEIFFGMTKREFEERYPSTSG